MARLNKKAELFSHLTEVGIIREATGTHDESQPIVSAIAKGATSAQISPSATTVDGDLLIIGEGELMEVATQSGAPASSVRTFKNGVARAHAAGEPIYEAARTILGDLTDEGVQLTLAEGDFNAILAATQREPVGYLTGHIAQMAEFGILNLNPENLASALGMPESLIAGSGSSAAPTKLDLIPEDFASDTEDKAFYFKGVRKDGMIIEVQLWGVEVDPTALSQALQFSRGQQMPTPFRVRPTAGVRWLSYT